MARGGGGGGSRGGGGFRGGGSRGGFGGGFGGRPGGFGGRPGGPPPPRHFGPRFHFGFGRRYGYGYGYGSPLGAGCSLISFLLCFIIFAIIVGGFSLISSVGTFLKATTFKPLDPGLCQDYGEYYYDEADTQVDPQTAAAMREFYERTGVQPFLIVTNTVGMGSVQEEYPGDDALEKYSNDQYDERFEDEGHLLIVYYEDAETYYYTWWVAGSAAHESIITYDVMDSFWETFDGQLYYSNDLGRAFEIAFKETADEICPEASPVGGFIFALICVAAVVVLAVVIKKLNKPKNGGSGDYTYTPPEGDTTEKKSTFNGDSTSGEYYEN